MFGIIHVFSIILSNPLSRAAHINIQGGYNFIRLILYKGSLGEHDKMMNDDMINS